MEIDVTNLNPQEEATLRKLLAKCETPQVSPEKISTKKSLATSTPEKKRGRPPQAQAPLTNAERQKRYRERKKRDAGL